MGSYQITFAVKKLTLYTWKYKPKQRSCTIENYLEIVGWNTRSIAYITYFILTYHK